MNKYNVNSLLLGKAGEYRVSSELILRGHTIYLPGVDDGIDVIIDDNIKIQIKCGQKRERKQKDTTVYSFNVRASQYNYHHDKKPKPHLLKNVNYVICWAIDDDEFYIIPADKIRGTITISFTADDDRRTKVKWNKWYPYRNAWQLLDGVPLENIKPKEEIECKQCSNKWIPLTDNPIRCPKCNGRWYQKMYDHQCKRCGVKWHSRLEVPNWCPYCNSKVWDKEKQSNNRAKITCTECGYSWQPEVDKPSRCPKCKTRRYLGGIDRECSQCGYKWFSNINIVHRCPQCHSSKWYKDKILVAIT